MIRNHYILKNGVPVIATLKEWGEWFNDDNNRIIRKTHLDDVIEVSTVFIGVEGQMFETMIFGGEHNNYQERYSTLEEAKAGHVKAVKLAKGVKEWDE